MLLGLDGDVDRNEAEDWVSCPQRNAQPLFSPVSGLPAQVGAMVVVVDREVGRGGYFEDAQVWVGYTCVGAAEGRTRTGE